MKRPISYIVAGIWIMVLATSCSRLNGEVLYNNIFEPYYHLEYALNGEQSSYTATSYNTADLIFMRDDLLMLSIKFHTPRKIGIVLKTEGQAFVTGQKYRLSELNIINKFGHLCTVDGDWYVVFNEDGLKAYEMFEFTFEGDCLDPDTGEISRFRDGRFVCCKNLAPQYLNQLTEYIHD